MSITKKDSTFILDIRIDSKRIRRSLGTDNYMLALDKANALTDQLTQEHDRSSIKFTDFCKQYMDWAWSSKPASALREGQRLEKIKSFFEDLGIVTLSEISPFHVEKLKSHLKDTEVSEGKKMSKATINRYLQILRGMFYKAIDLEIYEGKNPVKKVRFYQESSPAKSLSPEEVKKVVTAAKEISNKPLSDLQKAFYDLVVFALNTGLRKSETLNLKWKDIKGEDIEVKGKGEKYRTVPLNETALAIINKQPKKTAFVFDVPNRNQQDLLPRTVLQLRKRSGIPFHFHLLRHTFTTRLIEKGVDFVTISEILGHSKLTTSLIYSHTDTEKKKRAVELLLD